ncbi:MAG: hypothetical protein J0H41_12290 [Rhizobiales bacterium]|nr:hypothetical protein [Hyphomicrobiales bacterium]
MTKESSARERLSCTVEDALRAATAMGRVMLTANAQGATHERIGAIEAVSSEGHALRLSGAAHDAAIDPATIESVVADRTGRMKDKALPRLEFLGADGAALFSLICLDGLEPFDAAMKPLGAGAALPEKEKPAPGEPATLADDDQGAAPFTRAAASGEPLTISLRRDGLVQRWTGVVQVVKPAMGFINIITPDFHLHLRGGAVAGWTRVGNDRDATLHAVNGDGGAIGLELSGPAARHG